MTLPAATALLLPDGAALAWPALPSDAEHVRRLPAGAPVALADRRPGGGRRLRRAAGRLGVRVETEYLVLPTWERATFVVADDTDAVRWLLSTFLTAPPRLVRGRRVAEALIAAAERAWRTRAGASLVRHALGALAAGRLLVGTRR